MPLSAEHRWQSFWMSFVTSSQAVDMVSPPGPFRKFGVRQLMGVLRTVSHTYGHFRQL